MKKTRRELLIDALSELRDKGPTHRDAGICLHVPYKCRPYFYRTRTIRSGYGRELR